MAKSVMAVPEQQAAQDLAQLTGINVDPQGYIRGEADPGKAPGRMRDAIFENKMAVERNRNRALGILPATVFNFLPIQLIVNGTQPGLYGGVPAVKGDAKFSTRTWRDIDVVPFDTGEGREPHIFHPLQTAEAFEKEYPHGGVVALFGGVDAAEKPENRERMEAGKRDAVRWMRGQLAKGDSLWNAADRMQRQLVSIVHRACAERLYALKIIKVLPDWVHATVELDETPVVCPTCGATPTNRKAVKCNCGWILDPEQAFARGVISEEHESLERLTRKQVVALGISDFVAETVDEAAERRKAGVPKPPSVAVQRIMAAEDAQQGRK
jgi:hypothetical protein